MIEIKDAYIFNYGINKNKIKIMNDIDFIKEQLIHRPIMKRDKIIGIVTAVTNVIGDKIYGTVMLMDDKYKNYKHFKNYEIMVDDDIDKNKYQNDVLEVYIKSINSIELSKNKEEI
jgi:hypothetical protein